MLSKKQTNALRKISSEVGVNLLEWIEREGKKRSSALDALGVRSKAKQPTMLDLLQSIEELTEGELQKTTSFAARSKLKNIMVMVRALIEEETGKSSPVEQLTKGLWRNG